MGEAKRRKQLDPNYGKAKKQIKSEILIKTLSSEDFHQHIKKTLWGMTPNIYEPIITKLINSVKQGLHDKWLGLNFVDVEFRVGYENGEDCYTMIIQDGVAQCFNYGKESQFVIPTSPDKLTFTTIGDFLNE